MLSRMLSQGSQSAQDGEMFRSRTKHLSPLGHVGSWLQEDAVAQKGEKSGAIQTSRGMAFSRDLDGEELNSLKKEMGLATVKKHLKEACNNQPAEVKAWIEVSVSAEIYKTYSLLSFDMSYRFCS